MKRFLICLLAFMASLSIIAGNSPVTVSGSYATIDGVVYDYKYTYTLHEEVAPGTNRYTFEGSAWVKDGHDAVGNVEIVPSISVVLDEVTGHTESINVSRINPLAFSGNTMVTSVIVPDGVSFGGIDGNHFSDCTNLVSISLPGGISIPYRCFLNCTSLETVTLRGPIIGIGEDAFRNCTSLKSIDLSKGVNELGRSFYLSGLESVILPETGLTSIGQSCFSSTKLKSINVPASVTSIGAYFCSECTELAEAVILGGVQGSYGSQFRGCTKLTKATVNWTGSLPGRMFNGCTSLSSVILGGSISAIGGGTFMDCTALQSLSLPNTVTSIGGNAFEDCTSLQSITIPNSVTEIKNAAFNGCTSLDNITIPSGVTDLSNNVFEGCTNLKSVSLPMNMTRIGYGSFRGCRLLAQITLPTSLVTIDYEAFKGCSSLDGVNLPTGLEIVNSNSFEKCTSLKSLTFPASMKTLGNYAFSGTSSMELIDLRASTNLNITSTERTGVFSGVPESTIILLPGTNLPDDPDDDIINFADAEVKRICVANWDTSGDSELSYREAEAVTDLNKQFANNTIIKSFDELQYFTGLKALNYNEGGEFELCENLEAITLPEGLETIGEATFNYCRALKGINIPASVTEMSYLGGWYYGMTTITVAAGNSVYDSRNNCNAVIETATNKLISGCNSTVIPNTVTAIGPFAFNACVTDPIAIPTSVTTIGRAAFSTCQFTEITLPSSITSIDISFAGCSQIKKVVSRIIEPFAIEDATFDQTVYNNATLWVPTDDAVSKYKDADGWKNFKDIRSSMIIVVMDDKDDQQDYFKSECKYNDDNSLEIVNVDEASGDVEIPSAIVVDNNQIAVTSIADGAFANSSITLVTIPATITSIGDGAFSGCNNLEYVDLSNASGLAGLTVHDVNRDGNGAFAGLSEGTVIVLPSSVSTTTAQAFSTAEPNIVYRDGSDYKSENVSLADKATFSVPASVTEVKVTNVSYGRTFNRNDVVYSICLPYDQPLAEGLKAYELEEFNNGSLVFKETGGAVISAGKPYLVTTLQSVDGMSAENVTMYIGGNGNDKVVTDYTFCGTLKTITNEEAHTNGYLIMQSDKLWHPVPANNAAVNIPAGRAYLKPNNSNARAIKRTVLKDNDEVTYIKTIDYDGTATYYDLNGHRIGEPVKAGVYVKDGNKVVVK